ncbi:ABC transporter substrate-binding protein [Thalassotalea sp. PLHSN55]|uniref:ABC transporter substrate-binding protein n=1 Tax=Thalassotalea sp. PLHSN55 TaxID=3435888 RepID=UPI003F876A1F
MRCWLIIIALIMFDVQAKSVADSTIVLPFNGWVSQRILTKIVGNKISELGYKVEYLPINSIDQIGALRTGLVHLQIETWQNEGDGNIQIAIDKGLIEDLGTHSAIGREEWWYPKFVEKLCPGLPNWQALNACAEIFSNQTEPTKGVFYTGPWNHRDPELVRSLDLNFSLVRLKNERELWEKFIASLNKKQPIVMLNWTPSWIFQHFDGSFVEFPPFEEACKTSPRWGINKTMTHDCGNPRATKIKKVAWPGLKNNFPCIYQLIQRVNFTSAMIAEATLLYGVNKRTEQQAIDFWMKEFSAQSSDWLEYQCES